MAALNDGITDVELRRKLKELGEDVGPVTDATRSLLFRKLKRLEKERKGRRAAEEKSSPRRASPGRKSSGQSQTPSRRLIGFSSDEEDAPQSSAKSYKTPRGRLSEGSALYSEPAARKRKSTRNSNNRQSLPNSVSRFADNTVSDSGWSRDEEATDSDGQIYSKSSDRTRYSKFAYRPLLRPRYEVDERETRTVLSSLSRYEDVSDESEPTIPQRENQAGAKKAKNPIQVAKIVLLISGVCVILLCMALKWYSSEDLISEHLEKLPLCGNGLTNRELKPPDCATLGDISKKYAGLLFQKLSTKAGLFDCGDPNVDSRNVSLEELREQIREDNASRSEEDQNKILNTTLDLMTDEASWKIRLLSKQDEEVFFVENATWVDTLLSTKPLTCRIQEAMSRLVYLFLVMALIIGGLLFGYFIVRQRWRREEEETRKMYQFVEKIIDILREHHEASKTDKNLLPYLAIPHVRDMLIPPSERQNLSKVWSRAVRFLSANESRIRVESQRIAGEDFEVWRWIHIAPPKHHSHKMSLSGTKHGKFWQGQAFENFQSAVNPPVISPTPCLKIRNMFDPDVETEEGWHVMIQDAILEKCIENGASVVHIAVDKSSSEGCVYVKCDSHHSAGLAFRSLHGCWFDGRLVAVKYLTLKRYHQRFPVALEATENLSPSGSSPSSLVTFDPDEGEDDDDVNDSDVEVV